MQAPVYSLAGEVIEHIEVSDQVFDVPFNEAVVHRAMLRQRANARQGTASTKTRSEVSGSSRKLYRQKNIGAARAGSIRSPLRRGGGVAFGPKPRSYRQAMPKKMRQLALKCMLSAKARDDDLMILEALKLDEPKTKEIARILSALKVESSALIVTAESEANVIKAARNLVGIKTLPASLLNVVDLLSCKMLLMEVAAVRKAEQFWGEGSSREGNNEPLRDTTPPLNN